MTLKLAKSAVDALPYNFEQAVADFIKAKEDHRTTGDAAPHAEPLVEAAVRRISYPISDQKPDDWVPYYEIIDDTPPPPTLAERKAALVDQSRATEQAQIDALMPRGKRRLLELDFQRAVIVPEQERTPEQLKAIADVYELQKQIGEVSYAAAQREAAIDDIAE